MIKRKLKLTSKEREFQQKDKFRLHLVPIDIAKPDIQLLILNSSSKLFDYQIFKSLKFNEKFMLSNNN
jgi:hypothetical protein